MELNTYSMEYTIRNIGSGNYYLNVTGYSTEPSAQVEQWDLQPEGSVDRKSQLWFVVPYENGYYMVINKASGLYLNVFGYITDRSAQVEQWHLQKDANVDSQLWKIEKINEKGGYTFQNKASGKYLNIEGFSTKPSAKVEQSDLQTDSHKMFQHWDIMPTTTVSAGKMKMPSRK
jgi:endoglucanase